jgi:uncharacterized protein (DUF1499 family)
MPTAASILGIASIALFVGGPALAHFRILPPLAGFGILALGGLLGLIATGHTLSVFLTSGTPPWAGVLGLPAALFIIYGVILGMSVPRINDISTDLDDPPAFAKAHSFPGNGGRDLGFPAGNAALIRSRYPTVKPLAVGAPADETFETLCRRAESWGPLRQIHIDPDTRTVEAFVETTLFRFHDDIIIRVRPVEHGTRIDMRSKSRDGQGDFGANAKRIQAFFDYLRTEMKELVV